MKDKNNKKSIFSANSYSEIMIAKKYTMTKLYKFFEKIRFDPIEDQIVKMYQSSLDKREFNLVLAH